MCTNAEDKFMKLTGNCKPMGIGSVPNQDAGSAWNTILDYFPEIPFWPQLPKRSYLENMYVQFSELIPGRVLDLENERFYIDQTQDLQPETEEFYNAYLSNDLDAFGITREYCEGLYSGLELVKKNPKVFEGIEFIKGQITGPTSFGLQVMDEQMKPILYNDMLHDIAVKNLQRKAQWQEARLKEINRNTIISVDEPYLSSIGSGFLNLNRSQVISDIETIFKPLTGRKAMHCCGNTDWSLILETSLDIMLFDAYNYFKNVILYSSELQSFLDRGGHIGWGIVPTTADALAREDAAKLIRKIEAGVQALVDKGFDRDLILHRSFITPACGLGTLPPEQAATAKELTRTISQQMRKKYKLG